jgi:hypothetical protein
MDFLPFDRSSTHCYVIKGSFTGVNRWSLVGRRRLGGMCYWARGGVVVGLWGIAGVA